MVNDSVPVVNRDYHLDKERDEGMVMKYDSILSPKVSGAFGPNMYGPRILFVASNGVKMGVLFVDVCAGVTDIFTINSSSWVSSIWQAPFRSS